MSEVKGVHVLAGFVAFFGIIISVNLTLAFNAVKTFPGLEVKNSYVASQTFDADRAAQEALNWDVAATVFDGVLSVTFLEGGAPIAPEIQSATFGRATSVAQDHTPAFSFNGRAFVAPVPVAGGNWNLRIKARADDGTLFQQRIIVQVLE